MNILGKNYVFIIGPAPFILPLKDKIIIHCVEPWLFRVINMEVNIIAADAQAPSIIIKSSPVMILDV